MLIIDSISTCNYHCIMEQPDIVISTFMYYTSYIIFPVVVLDIVF